MPTTMLAEPPRPYYKSSRVEKNKSRVNELYRKAADLNIERMAENCDRYACTYLAAMYNIGGG